MKKTFSFLDANRNKVTLTAEITDGRFSISGDMGGSCGQIIDNITPANDAQKAIIDIWHKWHLNDMKAGTELQEQVTKNCKDYDERLKTLVSTKPDGTPAQYQETAIQYWERFNAITEDKGYYDLIEELGVSSIPLAVTSDIPVKERAEKFIFGKTLLYDNGYRYGSAWLKRDLPEGFEEELTDIIEEIEEQSKTEPIQYADDAELIAIIEENTNFTDEEAELVAACVKWFDLSIEELQDIEIDGNRLTVQGTEYLAGDDDAMDEEWDDDLENYIDDCLEIPESMKPYFDREAWKEDARRDGRAHSLNRYDGGELQEEVNGTYYYAYRQ